MWKGILAQDPPGAAEGVSSPEVAGAKIRTIADTQTLRAAASRKISAAFVNPIPDRR